MNSEPILGVDNIIRTTDSDYEPYEPAGVLFFKQMQKYGDKIAQYISETDESDTFASLLQRSVRIALKMIDEGLSRGDIISICSHNHQNTSAVFIAATFLGVIIASLDPSLAILDTSHLINLVHPKMIFTTSEALNLIEESLISADFASKIVIFDTIAVLCDDNHQNFDEYLKPHKNEDDFRPVWVPLKDTATIFFSSGTTGLPKAICLSAYAILNNGYYINATLDLEDGCILLYSTLYWITSALFLYSSLMYGVSRVICKKFDPLVFWKYIDKYQVSNVFSTPFLASEVLRMGNPAKDLNISTFLTWVIAGGIFAEQNMIELKNLLPHTLVCAGYGQTESGFITGFCLKTDKQLADKKPKSCGKPLNGIAYKIVDPATEESLGPNQPGELRLKSKGQLNGYHNRDSKEAYDDDGWVKTGDIVCYDEDFCFYIEDRLKEQLRYRSVNVLPILLEGILETHPAVKKSVIIGIPHEIDGDHPMAIVILNDNYQERVDGKEIEEFLASKVHEMQKLRAGVKFVKEIPRTPTDKINRRMIRDMVISGIL